MVTVRATVTVTVAVTVTATVPDTIPDTVTVTVTVSLRITVTFRVRGRDLFMVKSILFFLREETRALIALSEFLEQCRSAWI